MYKFDFSQIDFFCMLYFSSVVFTKRKHAQCKNGASELVNLLMKKSVLLAQKKRLVAS